MIGLPSWMAALLGLALGFLSVLLVIWWRQQSYRWALLVALCLIAAPALSWWSGMVFRVADYRAGCDGLCPGYRGAPFRFSTGDGAGSAFLPGMFLLNSLAYILLLLAWSAVVRGVLGRGVADTRRGWGPVALAGLLILGPLLLAPFILPPPEARVRGDSLRVAINARREVYMYDQLAPAPVLRVGLDDVRPRRDGKPGMRVCLRTYTLFYLPAGYMYMDMAPDGVHSTGGGVLPIQGSCWS